MLSFCRVSLASEVFDNAFSAVELKGQGPVDDLLAPPESTPTLLGGTVQLLLEEGDEEGILFFAFLQRVKDF